MAQEPNRNRQPEPSEPFFPNRKRNRNRRNRPLSFLSLFFFWEKGKENHPKKQGFPIPTEPLKSLEKKGKTLKKNKEFLARRKNKEFPKNKERKDRGFPGTETGTVLSC